MASLKDIRKRIGTVRSTQQITKAMKMVAAAKLRRASEAAEAARPYSERMAAVLASLGSKVTPGPESPKLLAGTGSDRWKLDSQPEAPRTPFELRAGGGRHLERDFCHGCGRAYAPAFELADQVER